MAILRIDHLGGSAAAAGAIRERFGSLLRGPVASKAFGDRLVRATEYLLMAGVAMTIGLLFWTGLSPLPKPPAVPAPRAAAPVATITGPINPFGETETGGAAPPVEIGPNLAETTLSLTLHGTWIDEDGGTAIIGTPDGKQARYAVGDVITAGAKLERVYRDQVVLNRSGVRESLRLINRDPSLFSSSSNSSRNSGAEVLDAAAPLRATSAKSVPKIGGGEAEDGLASIAKLVVVTPQIDKIGNVRLTLAPSGDEAAFEKLGFRDGDRLVAIDNAPIGNDIAAAATRLSTLSGKSAVTITIERDGAVVPITIGAEQQQADGKASDFTLPESKAPVRD